MIATLLATVVLAQGGAGAEELWERYPLEPTATPTAEATRPSAEPSSTADSGSDGAGAPAGAPADDGPDTVTLVVLVALGALAGAAALRLAQKRSGGRRSEDAPPARAAAPREEPARADRPVLQPPVSYERPAETARTAPARQPRAEALNVPRAEPSPPAVVQPAEESRRFAPSPAGDSRVCRIRLWHGYVTRCFLAQIEGEDAPIARSATFRAVATPEATAALEGLVEELRARGWEPVHDAAGEWRGAMRRRLGASASSGGPATAG